MRVNGVPFFRPQIGEGEIAEVVGCMRNGWLTTGAKVAQFEAEFAEFIGGGVEAIAVNSATAAMHLALEAIGIGPGDEVIVPTYTFTATAEVVRYLGAKPVFVDCEEDTFNVGVAQVEPAITDRTKAIMPVHFAGLPCDMTSLGELARRHNLKVLDDAAHALPTRHRGRMIGNCETDATAFSFYANKTITTGEGGMLVTKNEDLARRARHMRLHGISRDVFNRFTDPKANWEYDIIAPGFKYNMTDIAAAIGLHQLPRAETFRTAREAICQAYDERLAGLPLILPAAEQPGDLHSRHLYIVRPAANARLDRMALIAALQEQNIGVSVHYKPLHRMTYWQETFGLQEGAFPNAEAIGASCISLPLFPDMSEAEIDYVVAALTELLSA
ncbi:MAG: UDP-4-amino-4,6-dideoxy-N-acetyl-beta-L-altrosamine transaminase [Erythrobacter sp.]|nr:UDP-4-amino-4,6-dideoxy-N-acetyl-beta-L-altrosamine transaminase [Erythrobacter sp.]|tara:strand:+ start:8587 stop:9744 length:1158 start_codon:yes stop_codon:yes gene_type:complete